MAESSSELRDLKVASWNVNKPGYGVEELIGILNTLSKYNVDVALLQETNIWDEFTEQYKEYTFFFPENEKMDLRSFHGVAVAVKNELKSYFEAIPVSDRIMHCILRYGNICLHFINVYAPTKYECAFYEHLQKVFEDIKKKQCIFLFGDFNAHVGPDLTAPACLGQYCVYNEPNTNGEKLMYFCEKNDLVIFNTFVRAKKDEKMTYHNEQTSSEVDLLVTQNEAFMWIKDLRPYKEPEHSDHCIVVSTFKTPSTMTVDIRKFVSLLSNKYIIGSETEKLNESSAWIIIRNLIANLYDFYRSFEYNSNKLFSEATKTISQLQVAYESYTNAQSERIEDEAQSQVQLKLPNASSRIKEYLLSLKKYGLQITENEVLNIEPVLREIFSTKQKIKVDRKGSQFKCNWDEVTKLPESGKIKHALEKIEDTKKYKFLENNIHSLVKDIWEKGHVPIELTLCIAGVFISDGEPKGKTVYDLIYDVIQHILNERLQLQASWYMKEHKRYTFSLSNEKTLSEKTIKEIFKSLGQNLYMAFIDFNDFKDTTITQTLLHFIRSSGIPDHMFELISYFAIGLRDTNGVSLAKCLLNVSVSILCHNMFEQFKEKGQMPLGLNIRAVHCNDRIVLIGSSEENFSTCLDKLHLNNYMGLPILTPIRKTYVHTTDEEFINLFSSLTLEENNSDSPGL